MSRNNDEMRRRHAGLGSLAARWRDALALEESARILPSVRCEVVRGLRGHHVRHSLRYLLLQLAGAVALGLLGAAHSTAEESPTIVVAGLAGAVVFALLRRLPVTIRVVRTALWHQPPDGSSRQIGIALAEALCQSGGIETTLRALKVICRQNEDGTFFVALAGATFYEVVSVRRPPRRPPRRDPRPDRQSPLSGGARRGVVRADRGRLPRRAALSRRPQGTRREVLRLLP